MTNLAPLDFGSNESWLFDMPAESSSPVSFFCCLELLLADEIN
jgi:hypothetical protein